MLFNRQRRFQSTVKAFLEKHLRKLNKQTKLIHKYILLKGTVLCL
jgi:hypothetical protein